MIIVSGTEASSKAAFEALSRLTKLESLDLGMDEPKFWDIAHVVPGGMHQLPWNLEHGLGQLSTLTKLRTVSLGVAEQETLTDEDVEWTAENLPSLEEVKGDFVWTLGDRRSWLVFLDYETFCMTLTDLFCDIIKAKKNK